MLSTVKRGFVTEGIRTNPASEVQNLRFVRVRNSLPPSVLSVSGPHIIACNLASPLPLPPSPAVSEEKVQTKVEEVDRDHANKRRDRGERDGRLKDVGEDALLGDGDPRWRFQI